MKSISRTILLTLLASLPLARLTVAENASTSATITPARQAPASAPAAAGPSAVDASALDNFRGQYDAMMASYELLFGKKGRQDGVDRVQAAREAMRALTDQQLGRAFSRTGVPDLTPALQACLELVQFQNRPKTAGFPGADAVVSNCDGVDTSPSNRYFLFIAKEVANSALAAAAWVCNEDILGENGSAACIPLAVAADVANGFFDTATFCAGEATANQVDANFKRLAHIHDDLAAAKADIDNSTVAIMTNDNSNKTSIINNDNANTTSIVSNDNANKTSIINNDNANTTSIINNDNANTAAIISNSNANKNELRDLILRTQIEQDLSTPDSSAPVVIFELPTANGGYEDLVQSIVTQTLANVLAAGGSIGPAQASLDAANAAKASGDFKTAYSLYRKAYKSAGK